MISRAWTLTLSAAAALIILFLGVANLRLGEVNQDEGWYLYSARMVSDGALPYRDFAFTQGPMMPLVYSLARPLVDHYGVAGGRFFTLLLGLTATALAALLALYLAPRGRGGLAFVLALALCGVNVYHSYFTTVVKTYALCSLFLAAGFLALAVALKRRSWLLAAVAGFILAAAAGTRISSGVALAVAGFYLLFRRKELGDAPWLGLGIGGALGLALILGPWLFMAPEGVRFGLFEYHTARAATGGGLILKAGFVSRVTQAYFIPLVVAVALALWKFLARRGAALRCSPAAAIVWLSVGAITLVHLSAPFPYDDYQTPLAPLFAAALAAALAATIPEGDAAPGAARWLSALVLVISIAASCSSSFNMDWFVRGRDRIWWRMRDEASLAKLQRVGAEIRREMPAGSRLLTQDTLLAVEAGLRVPPGMEMGPFCYYPSFTDERASKLHVLSKSGLRAALSSGDAPVAAFSAYGLCIASPEVTELSVEEQAELRGLLERGYEPVRTEPFFGQGQTTLTVYRRRAGAEGGR